MFASQSLTQHLSRGALGISALVFGIQLLGQGNLTGMLEAVGLLVFSLVMLRGCPTCWTIGLIQTIATKFAGRNQVEKLLGRQASCNGSCPLQ